LADIPGDSSTTSTLSVGSSASSTIDFVGDHDWFAINLIGGQAVDVTLTGITLQDPYLIIRDSSGNILYSNDDIVDGVNRNSEVKFDPSYTGTYYIDASAWVDPKQGQAGDSYTGTGTYTVSVQPYTPPPVATNDQIANELTSGYWGGDVHHWAVTQGGTLTVDIHTLTAAEQNFARTALQEWTDIIGVHFQEVTSGAQITFSDAKDSSGNPVAQTDASWSNGIITSANVQISSNWDSWTSLDSYGLQTYVHEIGHALGLGHAGNYNDGGTGASAVTYPYDAMFANDSWSTSVMSYFPQANSAYFDSFNGYFAQQGFSYAYALTPMVADIVAMQSLYGLSTTTRTGDTVYGDHSNAGGVYDASLYPQAAFTIFDSGGNDTIDYSLSSANQLINLNPETFSNVNGLTGNLEIARGTVIENAIGGAGDDTIVQNSASNVLNGGGGTNTVSYETATAGVTVNLGLTSAQNTGGAGIDTLSNFQKIIGSPYGDTLIASPTTVSISGGAGDDLIDARLSNPGIRISLSGGDGNDTFLIGSAQVAIDGGAGFNIVDASGATSGISLVTDGGSGNMDSAYAQEIIGSNYADYLWITGAGETAYGGGGDDTLVGVAGSHLFGGAGNDTYEISSSSVQITENPGEGADTVDATTSYTLGPNVENLTLENVDPYAGAAMPSGPVQEDFSGTGNELDNIIVGNAGNNVLSGGAGNDTLTGGAGVDTLTGGTGNDTFLDTAAGLNGDTITDFSPGDRIIIRDDSLTGFSFSLSGHTLSFTGGSITLTNLPAGDIIARPAPGLGVELTVATSVHEPAHNDFTGDGSSDVLWRNDSGLVTDWVAKASGTFAGNGNLVTQVPTDWHIVGTGDFNGDGRVDVLWQNDAGVVTDWLANADGTFAGNAGLVTQVASDWHVAGTGDFNGDGVADVLWQNNSGAIIDWLGKGDGSFVGNDQSFSTALDSSWHVAGTGDFNGDGIADILWRNDSGTVTDELGEPNGTFVSNQANLSTQVDSSWHIAATGDFNGDGLSDVLWQNNSGAVLDWLGQTNGTFVGNSQSFTTAFDTSWHVVQTGDFNGDGIDDILWRNDNGTVTEWFGRDDGTFVSNQQNLQTQVPTDWHVQDAFAHNALV